MLIFALNPEACQKAIAIVSAYYKHFNTEKWHTAPLTIKRDDMNYILTYYQTKHVKSWNEN